MIKKNSVVRTLCLFEILTSFSIQVPAQSSWTMRNMYPTCNDLNCVIWTGTKFVAVGDAGTVLVSENATSWTIKNTGLFTNMNSITWTGKLFLAVGDSGKTFTSN